MATAALIPDNPRSIAFRDYAAQIGQVVGLSDWVLVDQQMIDDYAKITDDYGPVHVDEKQSKERGLDGTIAHGLLTLSLCSNVGAMVKTALPTISDRRLLLNYGYDRIRFIAPVPRGRRIRAQYRLIGVDERVEKECLLRYEITVELEGDEKPVMFANWLFMVYLK